jgi:cell division protein FtsW
VETFRRHGFDKGCFWPPSASSPEDCSWSRALRRLREQNYHQKFYFTIQQFVGAAVSHAVVFVFLLRIRRPFYKEPAFVFGLLGLTLALLLLALASRGGQNEPLVVWPACASSLPSWQGQPGVVSGLVSGPKREKIAESKTLAIPMSIILVFVFLILREPDFGTAVLVLALCLIVLFLGGRG